MVNRRSCRPCSSLSTGDRPAFAPISCRTDGEILERGRLWRRDRDRRGGSVSSDAQAPDRAAGSKPIRPCRSSLRAWSAADMAGARRLTSNAPPVRPTSRAHLTQVEADGRRVVLAPGLSYIDESGQPDVIRGEETEIFGVADSGARLIVLPGSHSKWARGRGRPGRRVQDLCHRRTVRGAAGSYDRRRLRPSGGPPRVRDKPSRSGSAAAPPPRAAKDSLVCLAFCSARERCRSWASSRRMTLANISPVS